MDKSDQIQNMLTFFYKAERGTIAWLGEKKECGFETLRFLHEFDPNIRHSLECSPGLVHIVEGIDVLCQRKWFRRTWVRQEVFAARNLIIQVQDIPMTWDDLTWRIPVVLNHISAHLDVFGAGQSIKDLCSPPATLRRLTRANAEDAALLLDPNTRKAKLLSDQFGIAQFLHGSLDFEATDERDYVYGLVSMTSVPTISIIDATGTNGNTTVGPLLGIDYSRSEVQVYADTTIWFFQQTKFLDVIFMASQTQKRCNAECKAQSKCGEYSLPSWVSDWRHRPSTTPLDQLWDSLDYVPMWNHDGEYINSDEQERFFKAVQSRAHFGAHTYDEAGYVKTKHRLANPLPSVGNDLSINVSGTVLGRLQPKGYRNITKIKTRIRGGSAGKDWVVVHFKDIFKDFDDLQEMAFDPDSSVHIASPTLDRETIIPWHGGIPAYHYCTSELRNSLMRGKCLVSNIAQAGDWVVMLDGTSLPSILRPSPTEVLGQGGFRMVGPVLSAEYCFQELYRRWYPSNCSIPRDRRADLGPRTIDPAAPVSVPIQDMPIRDFRLV